MQPPIPIGSDGYYHPATEAELVSLVQWAHDGDRQLRVRGATHTFPNRAIFTDRDPGASELDVNVMLDKYRAIRWIDEARGIVEVEAGCNLSINPYDPTHTSTLENGLLYNLQQKGWALSDLGGITHQTVSGFLSTGSSGGSLKWGIDENVLKFRFIDGTGQVHEASKDQNPDLFLAVGVSMGLLGVISSVTLQCVPTFNIKGSESTTTEEDCEIDLFGAGTNGKPSLEQFLQQTDYSRLMWWPQSGVKRVVVWKAERLAASPDFVPKPYEEMGDSPETMEVMAGLLLSIIGNLDNLSALPKTIAPMFDQLDEALLTDLEKLGLPAELAGALAKIIAKIMEVGVDGVLEFPGMDLVGRLVKDGLPLILPPLFKMFVTLDSDKSPPGPQQFQDYAWKGLPMDNGMDDVLMPTLFTEIWIPLSRTREVMTTLRDFFERGGLDATGTYSFELYAAKASPFWLSASYGEPVFRVDVFWFGYNAGDPTKDFYPKFWDLLAPFGFKLHWGKYLPNDPAPLKSWAKYLSQQFAHWNDFLAQRARLDPKNIFLTSYWREHLGLEDALPKR
ncbi:D-arabinono-1,4-lactone oxidase [Polyangium aurulentum]|uniref:D-arabinono-1,4-lactone oxidase n=1 Tax=Polyangium aurulentum TaxID=2567896 RepID=UPI0010AE0991|nr:D-arabinono-1,4-lactone oxidase [Polyangium aurulentum]UQA57364.1 FAD-binding protein [Polyangium aurulentum]